MLRAVVLKGPAYIGHQRHKPQICNKNNYFYKTLDEVLCPAERASERVVGRLCQQTGEKKEYSHTERKPEHHRDRHYDIDKSLSEMLAQPPLELGLLFLLG